MYIIKNYVIINTVVYFLSYPKNRRMLFFEECIIKVEINKYAQVYYVNLVFKWFKLRGEWYN